MCSSEVLWREASALRAAPSRPLAMRARNPRYERQTLSATVWEEIADGALIQ
jgi:hypothetical protein